jgi:hypothetical protein
LQKQITEASKEGSDGDGEGDGEDEDAAARKPMLVKLFNKKEQDENI